MENIAPVTVNAIALLSFTLGVAITAAVVLGILLKQAYEKLDMAEYRARIASRK